VPSMNGNLAAEPEVPSAGMAAPSLSTGRGAVRRPRVLLSVHSASVGGAERLALAEAQHLKRSFDLVIAVPEGVLRPEFARHGRLIGGTTPLPLWGDSARGWLVRLARTLHQSFRLARVIRGNDVEAVITNSSVSLAPVLAGRIAGVPVIVHARDVPASRLAPLVLRLEGLLARTVIVISPGLRPYFAAGRRARIIQIPDGIEIPELEDGATDSSRPARFGRPLRLCLIGGVDPRKGQDIAVEALAELRQGGLDAELDLVGREINPEFAASLRALVRRLGVASHVRFVGELEDVPEHLGHVDVVIAPSRGEWTPLSLMEAMALQKPVVAASVGGVNDLIDDRTTGLLIPPEDPHRLATAIAEIATDPENASRMALRARCAVAAKFDIGGTLEGAEGEIRRAIANGLVTTDASCAA
jgi:glycosyltransferase involved in cell wall biosynthesis